MELRIGTLIISTLVCVSCLSLSTAALTLNHCLTRHTSNGQTTYSQEPSCLDKRTNMITRLYSGCKLDTPMSQSACNNRTRFMEDLMLSCGQMHGSQLSRGHMKTAKATGTDKGANQGNRKTRPKGGRRFPKRKTRPKGGPRFPKRKRNRNAQNRPQEAKKQERRRGKVNEPTERKRGKAKTAAQSVPVFKPHRRVPSIGKIFGGMTGRTSARKTPSNNRNTKQTGRTSARKKPSNNRNTKQNTGRVRRAVTEEVGIEEHMREKRETSDIRRCCSNSNDQTCESIMNTASERCDVDHPSGSPRQPNYCSRDCFFGNEAACTAVYEDCMEGNTCSCGRMALACQEQCGDRTNSCKLFFANYMYPKMFTN